MIRKFKLWLLALDKILRGESTRLTALRTGTIDVPVTGLAVVILVLAMTYGACMGSYGLYREDGPSYLQLAASTIKVPALFFFTLVVTFPSLYVFNALVGSRLTLYSVLSLLVAALGVNLAVLSSLGPVVAFFSASTTSHDFMVLLNVLVFAGSGVLGLGFLLQTLHRLSIADRMGLMPIAATEPAVVEAEHLADARPPAEPGALERVTEHLLGTRVKTVFVCWIVMFGLVGAQMSWILRPFIGDPGREFTWFRHRGSNFFQAVWHVFWNLL